MRYAKVSDPVYAPNSKGGPNADTARYGEPAGWHTDGEMVRTAYTLHVDDDDWGQAGTLVRQVMSDAERDRLVGNIVGPPARRRHRAGAGAGFRVLAQRRPGPGPAGRGRRSYGSFLIGRPQT